jgi:hypothetical protein
MLVCRVSKQTSSAVQSAISSRVGMVFFFLPNHGVNPKKTNTQSIVTLTIFLLEKDVEKFDNVPNTQ